MGHKSGLKHTEAKGKGVPMTRNELESELDAGHEVDIKEIARKHDKAAISVLARAVKRRGKDKAPWAVATGAAKTLIEIGHGKSETREPEDKTGGLTIVINELTIGGQSETRITAAQIARDLAETIDVTPEGE
jgi:hypothetical protein